MTLQITSQTTSRAPNGIANTRRVVGVGEIVNLSANRPADWTIPEMPSPGRQRQAVAQFLKPGRKTIRAQAGRDVATHELRVVGPSMLVRKVRDQPVASGFVGASMLLRFTLTPLDVCFGALEVRERTCPGDQVWGYFDTHRSTYGNTLVHDPDPSGHGNPWKTVNYTNNEVMGHDTAEFKMAASRLNWPITAGGFRWQIPDVYRIGQQEFPFARPMTQAIRIDPAEGADRAPFRGTITVWKGGQRVRKVY